MSNKQIIFADRLVNASVHNGLVRLDLGVFAAAVQDKDGKPAVRYEPAVQLVIPLEAFATAVAMQDKVLKELAAIEQRRRDAAASGSAAGEAGA